MENIPEPTDIDCPLCPDMKLLHHPESEEYWSFLACPQCETEYIFNSENNSLELVIDPSFDDAEELFFEPEEIWLEPST